MTSATAALLDRSGEVLPLPELARLWPLGGWRKLDAGTGIEGGTTEGIFACEWRGNELLGEDCLDANVNCRAQR